MEQPIQFDKPVRPLLIALSLLSPISGVQSEPVRLTYSVNATDFIAGSNTPMPPTSVIVAGQVTFTIDPTIGQFGPLPAHQITGIDITDSNGVTVDYDQTNSGVVVDINIFTEVGRFTFGGLLNGAAGGSGLSDDWVVVFDISLLDFSVTALIDRFRWTSAGGDSWLAGTTVIELVDVQGDELFNDGFES